jgi:precorrin-2 dehydrogenase / sirohydrochlorin ferrochelatase
MKLFPAFFDLAGRPCLVAGGGRVGLEKAKSLLSAGAAVLVVEPAPSPELRTEAGERLAIDERCFRTGDCRGRFLVFACTGTPSVNDAVASDARAAGALCCRVDGRPGDFTMGAVLRRGELCVSVSSGGASPRLAAEARDRVAEAIGEEYGEAARLLASLREKLRSESLAPSQAMGGGLVREVLAALRSGDAADAEALLEQAFVNARADTTNNQGSSTR